MNQQLAVQEGSNGAVPTHAPQPSKQQLVPAISIETIVARRKAIKDLIQHVFEEGRHFGVIPGTDKPTLYQPGAQELNVMFGLVPVVEDIQSDLDWTGSRHDGEPFIRHQVRIGLYRDGVKFGEGVGSANSWEKKHRKRYSAAKCPTCGVEAIKFRRDKAAWCNQGTGGCGANFTAEEAALLEATRGVVNNPEFADLDNTLLKMAKKRGLVDSTLNATACSDSFTQDLEDQDHDEDNRSVQRSTGQSNARAGGSAGQSQAKSEQAEPEKDSWKGALLAYASETGITLGPDDEALLFSSLVTEGLQATNPKQPEVKITARAMASKGGVDKNLYRVAVDVLRSRNTKPSADGSQGTNDGEVQNGFAD